MSILMAAEPVLTPGQGIILTAVLGVFGTLVAAIVELRKARVTAQLARDNAAVSAEKISAVEHEMRPNSGGSLRDAVNRLGGDVRKVDDKLDGLVERLVRLETRTEYFMPPRRRESDHGQ